MLVSFGMAVLEPARAGILYNHPNALATNAISLGGRPQSDGSATSQGRLASQWSGRYELKRSNGLIFGEIEYAVFREDVFAALYPAADTPNGALSDSNLGSENGFVYAFQVRDNGSTTQGITQFSAGLADVGAPILNPTIGWGDGVNENELVVTGDSSSVAGTGAAPSSLSITSGTNGASSARFNWASPNQLKGTMGNPNSGWSAILFYTSPYGPRWDNAASTGGGGFGLSAPIPGPEIGIPEPASFALATFAICALAMWRRQRAT
jgi:hypothetical protein